MQISSLLREELINLNLKSKKKKEVIQELVDLVTKVEEVSDKNELLKTILDREELETTGIGNGIAIPHGRTDSVKRLIVAFGRSDTGVDFKAMDELPVYLIFLVIAPLATSGQYLRVLAKISRLLKDYDFCRALRNANSPAEVIQLFKEAEKD